MDVSRDGVTEGEIWHGVQLLELSREKAKQMAEVEVEGSVG